MTRAPEDRFIERMGGALTDAGLARLPSRVFAALVVDDDGRMTSAELTGTLGVSPASVSTAVAYLTRVGFIHRDRERGTRRDVYVVDDDAWLQAMLREDQTYAPLIAALDGALEGLAPDAPARHRLVLMREFLLFVGEEMRSMVDRWAVRRAEIEAHLGLA